MAPATNINCCKFDQDGEYLAVWHQAVDKHRLKVWDSNTNVIKVEFCDDQINKFTCMNWGLLRVANKEQSSKKKRKSSANTETTIKVIALGTEDGSVTIYSVSHGSVLKTLRGAHNQRVNDVCFSPDDHSVMYSCDDNGQIIEWDLNASRCKSQWNNGNGSVYRVSVANGKLFAASSSLTVWDLASKKIIKTFTGHATAISQILPLGETGDSDCCFTIADQDRFVNIWPVGSGTSETTALTLEGNARTIEAMGGRVLAVTEEGTVAIWRQPLQAVTKKQKKSRTKRFESLLRIEDEQQQASTVLPIAAAKFIQPEQVIVVYGALVKPKIEIIYLDSALQQSESTQKDDSGIIILKRQANNNVFIDNDQQRARQQLKASQKLYSEQGAVIAAQNDFVPTRMTAMEVEDEEVLANGEATTGLTLQEKLDALTVADESVAKSQSLASGSSSAALGAGSSKQGPKKSGGAPRADSIQQMLMQALHSEDHQLLDECLEMGDLRLIFNTVHRLPTAFIVPFLKQIVRRFQSRPGRGTKLAKWIKAVLLIHMAYLMTVPGLTNELGPLYQTIDMRLAAFKKLLRLQGRLDVLDQHIRLRQDAASQQQKQQQQLNDESMLEVPLVVFDENEAAAAGWSDEEDDMEIEEGLAEDAAVVDDDGSDNEGWSSSDDDVDDEENFDDDGQQDDDD